MSKKYRLTKWYPDLPRKWNVGDIFEHDEKYDWIHNTKMPALSFKMHISQVYSHPDNWEEVNEVDLRSGLLFKDKSDDTIYKIKSIICSTVKISWINTKGKEDSIDYKIDAVRDYFSIGAWIVIDKEYSVLSFMNTYTNEQSTLRDNGCYVWDKIKPEACPNGKGETFDNMNNSEEYKHYEIHAVKRLYDGVVFTVGDKICGTQSTKESMDGYVSINKIYIEDDHLYLKIETGKVSTRYGAFSKIKIYDVLFTTLDGVDITKGNFYYYIITHNDKPVGNSITRTSMQFPASNWKIFYNKENARKYLEDWKPKFSKAQVLKAIEEAPHSGALVYADAVKKNLKID